MTTFILNNQTIETDLPAGLTVLDFVRYRRNLKGTKIGCREGDCGACTVLVGELTGEGVRYRSQTSCLMPLANAQNKHIVSVEGINEKDGGLTPVQQALVDESGTQCGFCTVGFVMSLTGFCVDSTPKNAEMAVSAIDGNICRCTGYKSIERAAVSLLEGDKETGRQGEGEKGRQGDKETRRQGEGEQGLLELAIQRGIVPEYFSGIGDRLADLASENPKSEIRDSKRVVVGGGTDLYVQKHDEMVYCDSDHMLFDDELRRISDAGEYIEIGASVTVTDLLESTVMRALFPNLYKHLKLVSSTPIRNMATLAGNFINASPIGDMTVWFLALDAEVELQGRNPTVMEGAERSILLELQGRNPTVMEGAERRILLKDLYQGYKDLAKSDDELIKTIRFKKPERDFHFNFEKVSKRKYLDISTVNTAISLTTENNLIVDAHVAAGGVAPIPLYLRETSAYLKGKEITEETVLEAGKILQTEISPISDVRGSKEYKRLLARQLFKAHFVELFDLFEE